MGARRLGWGSRRRARRRCILWRRCRSFLRPELFNRIDRIVPFMPLSRAAVGSIAQREIEQIAGRDGIRLRGVDFRISPAATAQLAEAGYDPRYGARPLKRVLEQQLLAPLSEALNGYADATVLKAAVEKAGDSITVKVRGGRRSQGAAAGAGDSGGDRAAAAADSAAGEVFGGARGCSTTSTSWRGRSTWRRRAGATCRICRCGRRG